MRLRLEFDFRLLKRLVGRKVQRGAFLWLQCPNRTRAQRVGFLCTVYWN